jgi:predicted RNase H-like HicB family nuclease
MLDDGTFCGTVAKLRGVVAVADTLERCRDELAEVVEEWVLVRVARGLSVPAIGGQTVRVRKAS